jgi:serine protease Do
MGIDGGKLLMKTIAPLTGILIIVGIVSFSLRGAPPATTTAPAEVASAPTTNGAPPIVPQYYGENLRLTPLVQVVHKTKDAVVYISSKKVITQRNVPAGIDPFFQQFFDLGPRYVPIGSLGSGFIIHPDGYIVTNNHVIDKARQITVELLDGRKFEDAELVSADPDADIAILKIKADKPLPALELGDSSDLMPGEPVIAVGNPLGFSHSVSEGIVSALHRDLKDDSGKVLFPDLIQTDAAINPGNSGGPLLNIYGQVIGINSAIRGDAQNIGFAIQVNRLRELIPELMNPAGPNKLDVPLKLKETRTLTPPANVQATVERASDGAKVLSIAAQRPKDIVDAYAILLRQKEGKAFKVDLEGKSELSIVPKKLPPPEALTMAKQKLGLTVEAMTPRVAEQFNLGIEDGIHILAVDRGSLGEKAGFRPDDILVQIGQFRISSLDDFGYILQKLPTGRPLYVEVIRDGQKLPGRPVL